MKNNVARSSELYNYEGPHPQIVTGYKSTQLDNYSDAYMLAGAIITGSGNIIRDAMLVRRIEYYDMPMHLSLTNYANRVDMPNYEMDYARYWNGYMVVLKPLLLFFDVADIKMINMICQFMLIFILAGYIWKKFDNRYALAFFMLIILLNPLAISISLHYSSVFYISMFFTFLLLRLSWKSLYRYALLFFIVGMLTAYFDQFTYPLITMGIPLIALMIKEDFQQKEGTWLLKTFFICSFFWSMGYVGMWGSKLVIGTLLTDHNVINNGLNRANQYLGEEEVTYIATLWCNIKILIRWPYVIGFGGTLIYFIVDAFRNNEVLKIKRHIVLPFLLVMCLPLVDMFFPDHSYSHCSFTFRAFGITLFGGFCMLLKCLVPNE